MDRKIGYRLAAGFVFAGLTLAVLAGCGEDIAESPAAAASSEYVLSTAPDGAQQVIAARESAADGDQVVVVGRIGGSVDPWIKDRAAFTLVDNSLQACSDIPGDLCKTPWDYCCATDQLPNATALVKFVDDQGQLVRTDARELLGVAELDRVVVRGTAQRDDDGNLTVLADGVYVQN